MEQRHYYGANHLHFLTAFIDCRARIFDSGSFKRKSSLTLDELLAELGFRIIALGKRADTT